MKGIVNEKQKHIGSGARENSRCCQYKTICFNTAEVLHFLPL